MSGSGSGSSSSFFEKLPIGVGNQFSFGDLAEFFRDDYKANSEVSLSDYYRGGLYVKDYQVTSNVPEDSTTYPEISIKDFNGSTSHQIFNINTQYNLNGMKLIDELQNKNLNELSSLKVEVNVDEVVYSITENDQVAEPGMKINLDSLATNVSQVKLQLNLNSSIFGGGGSYFVSTFAGEPGTPGDWNTEYFDNPLGISVSRNGLWVYVSDSSKYVIKQISVSDQNVSVLAGNGTPNKGNDTLYTPRGISVSQDGNWLYVADNGDHKIKQVNLNTGNISLLSGSGDSGDNGTNEVYVVDSTVNGIDKDQAKFNYPITVAVSPDGLWLYVADAYNHSIKQIRLSDGNVKTLSGSGYRSDNGTNEVYVSDAMSGLDAKVANFNYPQGVVLSPDGNWVYVADSRNNKIKKVRASNGETFTLSGTTDGYRDGTDKQAQFNNPTRISISPDGLWLYVTDEYNHLIRRVNANNGSVTTLNHYDSAGGTDDNVVIGSAKMIYPKGISVSPDGNYIYVIENRRIRKIGSLSASAIEITKTDENVELDLQILYNSASVFLLGGGNSQSPGVVGKQYDPLTGKTTDVLFDYVAPEVSLKIGNNDPVELNGLDYENTNDNVKITFVNHSPYNFRILEGKSNKLIVDKDLVEVGEDIRISLEADNISTNIERILKVNINDNGYNIPNTNDLTAQNVEEFIYSTDNITNNIYHYQFKVELIDPDNTGNFSSTDELSVYSYYVRSVVLDSTIYYGNVASISLSINTSIDMTFTINYNKRYNDDTTTISDSSYYIPNGDNNDMNFTFNLPTLDNKNNDPTSLTGRYDVWIELSAEELNSISRVDLGFINYEFDSYSTDYYGVNISSNNFSTSSIYKFIVIADGITIGNSSATTPTETSAIVIADDFNDGDIIYIVNNGTIYGKQGAGGAGGAAGTSSSNGGNGRDGANGGDIVKYDGNNNIEIYFINNTSVYAGGGGGGGGGGSNKSENVYRQEAVTPNSSYATPSQYGTEDPNLYNGNIESSTIFPSGTTDRQLRHIEVQYNTNATFFEYIDTYDSYDDVTEIQYNLLIFNQKYEYGSLQPENNSNGHKEINNMKYFYQQYTGIGEGVTENVAENTRTYDTNDGSVSRKVKRNYISIKNYPPMSIGNNGISGYDGSNGGNTSPNNASDIQSSNTTKDLIFINNNGYVTSTGVTIPTTTNQSGSGGAGGDYGSDGNDGTNSGGTGGSGGKGGRLFNIASTNVITGVSNTGTIKASDYS